MSLEKTEAMVVNMEALEKVEAILKLKYPGNDAAQVLALATTALAQLMEMIQVARQIGLDQILFQATDAQSKSAQNSFLMLATTFIKTDSENLRTIDDFKREVKKIAHEIAVKVETLTETIKENQA